MLSQFLPPLSLSALVALFEEEKYPEAFEQITEPLHQELYKRNDLSFLQLLSAGQELFVRYDYVRMQVLQGGFIQLIQNGYAPLLTPMPAMLTQIGDEPMAQLLDDVMRVYALNMEGLTKETSVEEFAKLYTEYTEFELLDERFAELNPLTEKALVAYALRFPDEFMEL